MLLLVKEIKNKITGEVHFKRWRLFESSSFKIYLHKICKSDEDLHEHNHPWNFISLILLGGYVESCQGKKSTAKVGSILFRKREAYHQIKLNRFPTWTLVFTYGEHRPWGYYTIEGHIDSDAYRLMKNSGMLK